MTRRRGRGRGGKGKRPLSEIYNDDYEDDDDYDDYDDDYDRRPRRRRRRNNSKGKGLLNNQAFAWAAAAFFIVVVLPVGWALVNAVRVRTQPIRNWPIESIARHLADRHIAGTTGSEHWSRSTIAEARSIRMPTMRKRAKTLVLAHKIIIRKASGKIQQKALKLATKMLVNCGDLPPVGTERWSREAEIFAEVAIEQASKR